MNIKNLNKLGLSSLLLGVFSLSTMFILTPPLVTAPIGIALGLVSVSKKKTKAAIAGIILNCLALLLVAGMWALWSTVGETPKF